jgi:EpsD family peptidyl-prolyl cis-trans isomerase
MQLRFAPLICLTLLTLTSCGKSDSAPQSEVAARVNGAAITTAELKAFVPREAESTAGGENSAVRDVLERAINQQILVEHAEETGLDSEPGVVLAVNAARKQVLAQAYLDKVGAETAKVTPEEVRAFYESQPALFGQRRTYQFREVSVHADASKIAELRKEVRNARSLSTLIDWLKAQSIVFDTGNAVRTADELPLDWLPNLAQMKNGSIALIESQRGASILELVNSEPTPVTLEAATPRIETYLFREKRIAQADAQIAKLRERAKVEYLGQFSAAR